MRFSHRAELPRWVPWVARAAAGLEGPYTEPQQRQLEQLRGPEVRPSDTEGGRT